MTDPAGGTERAGPSLLPTLPGAAYTSAEVFAREQERIFERLWTCAVHGSDLAEPGQFRTVPVGQENVLITRALDGAVHAFLNVCRHRGARLCVETAGRTRRTLRCPYHAWTYALDGTLVAAPNLTDAPDVDRSAYGLHRVHVREWLGYVWVCLAASPPSFEETVIGAATERLGDPAAIERYQVAGLRVGRRVSYDVAANWKLLVENFLECYHCPAIHPELVRVLPEFARGYAAQYYVGHGAEFGPDVAGFTVDGSPGVERLPGLTPAQDRRYYAITIRPQVFVNLVPDHVILHRMFPVAADRTLVECDWLYLPAVVEAGTDLDRSVELFDRVNRQDFAACERCQPAMASRAYAAGGVLVPSEHHLRAFHDWVQRLQA
ncbi:aromatic ring-hydroxylating dioxygenase subunit alpha [Frankia sp. AgB1.9]|uniref:aromatic ring-hydroxylating oxygenase subunit alpha n=1 Tax=unclassified Frankia TaxID=2632575 RepID=UPI0019323466|nr:MULTISPECIES: aromatic ring-hydroxylating dioxygenase subunit alpha [unclassified Frankia]MBL7490114.1 aromatic ring-hydroxylating dioxygenase subunit alpha [Frankia sp. AgW1.1]MBL7553245.1 aromatic ring-hydroxylating dioxygenase subunit alpha [Frankia sp. AgB1.9]MBL7625454.1 aromatic ring-hydroxylating dioxygenase subunit alpha [Frankia sp. AgB1.8]